MNQEDRELLIRMDERLTEVLRRMDGQDDRMSQINGRMKEMDENFNKRIESIDSRVNTLESWRWWLIGAAAAAGLGFMFFKDFILKR